MAIEKAQNKMISKEEVKTKDYFFLIMELLLQQLRKRKQNKNYQKLLKVKNKYD